MDRFAEPNERREFVMALVSHISAALRWVENHLIEKDDEIVTELKSVTVVGKLSVRNVIRWLTNPNVLMYATFIANFY